MLDQLLLPLCRNAEAFDAQAHESQFDAAPPWLTEPDGAEQMVALSTAAAAVSEWWASQQEPRQAAEAINEPLPQSADVR